MEPFGNRLGVVAPHSAEFWNGASPWSREKTLVFWYIWEIGVVIASGVPFVLHALKLAIWGCIFDRSLGLEFAKKMQPLSHF